MEEQMARDALNRDPRHSGAIRAIVDEIRQIARMRGLTLAQAAQAFGISESYLHKLRTQGNWKRPMRASTRRAIRDSPTSTPALRALVAAYDSAFCDPAAGLSRRSRVRSLGGDLTPCDRPRQNNLSRLRSHETDGKLHFSSEARNDV